MQLCSKIQDIGAKNAPMQMYQLMYEFLSHIYVIRYHMISESYITGVLFMSKKSANVILYNCSVNKLILCYILN